jgi:hypothetical protein
MKRKRTPSTGTFLKIHTLMFTIFVVFMSYSMSATFDYPAHANMSFDMFKFFVIERVTLMQLWGVVLLFHFGIHYIRNGWQKEKETEATSTQHLKPFVEETAETEAYPDVRKAKLH